MCSPRKAASRKGYQKMECAVCYEAVKAPVKLTCGHAFCHECVKSWYLKGTGSGCPMCRRPVYFRGFHKVRVDWEIDSWYEQCQQLFGDRFDAELEATVYLGQLCGLKRFSPKSMRELESTFECGLIDGLLVDEMDYLLNESGAYFSVRRFNRCPR